MNSGGVAVVLFGVLVITQVLGGDVLCRLGWTL